MVDQSENDHRHTLSVRITSHDKSRQNIENLYNIQEPRTGSPQEEEFICLLLNIVVHEDHELRSED